MFKSIFSSLLFANVIVILFCTSDAMNLFDLFNTNIECPKYSGMPGFDINKVDNPKKQFTKLANL